MSNISRTTYISLIIYTKEYIFFFIRNHRLLSIDIGHSSTSTILYTRLIFLYWYYYESLIMALIYLGVWITPNSSFIPLFFTIKTSWISLFSDLIRDKISLKSFLLLLAIFIFIYDHIISLPPTFIIQRYIALPDIHIVSAFYYHFLPSM